MPLGDPHGGQDVVKSTGKLLRVGQVWVPVSDLEQAVDTYTNVLGLKLTTANEEKKFVEMATVEGGPSIVLFVPSSNAEEQPGIKTGVVFVTDSIYDFHKVLVDEGIEFTIKPQRDDKGRLIARFMDDDGNEFEVLDSPKI
jgi:catechol 2,3-dioxygenase-like lactoylglutathione lyase family enzyme